jgi:hypothetical protein
MSDMRNPAEVRTFYQKQAAQLRERLTQSKIVGQFVPTKWLDELDEIIGNNDFEKSLHLPDHMLFLAYSNDLQLYSDAPDVIATLDEGIDRLRIATGKQFNDKLRDLVRPRDSFVPTVFELLILSKFAIAGGIVAYEPIIKSGVPEARVKAGGDQLLIEARAKMEKRAAECLTPRGWDTGC